MKAAIFITCLVDQFFPSVGEGMVKILRELGVELEFPKEQTCCGQPMFNAGYQSMAKDIAKRFINIFDKYEYIVAPSGSCTTMVKVFYPELFDKNDIYKKKAEEISTRLYEISSFIVNVLNVTDVGASFNGKVTYQDSCHLLRELGIKEEPRKLIKNIKGIDFVEMEDSEVCCGFGGTFSIRFPSISTGMMKDKIESIIKTGADYVVANDSSCLMHIAGGLSRQNINVKPLHLIELLNMKTR